ncbi:MAG: RNB domain-containing ribonuclease, partial [Legionellales bacterium]
DIYKVLLAQRSKRGALEFNTVETKIIFDADSNIKNIEPAISNYVNGIIEECMLAANVCTSKFLARADIPALYRVHEEPDPEKVENIRRFLKNRSLILGGGAKPKPEHYQKLMAEIDGHADQHLIQELLMRSLRQAIYTPENIGHFGLAYKSYAHFTSPIRRYPDLINHRAIRWILQRGAINEFIYDNKDMHNFGEHCSMTERRADKAVNGVINWLKCRFMEDKLGKTFNGVITNVTNFGVFVELKDIYVEGLLHITSLHNDYYRFDPISYSLRGKRSGISYNLGDPIKVLVAGVDVDAHEIDFDLVE